MDSHTAPSVEKNVPLVETANFLNREGDYLSDCKKVVKAFEETGCLVIRDPRVNQSHNEEVIDMMERFFDDRSKQLYNNQPISDVFPEYSYQIGATPEFKEKARSHCKLTATMSTDNKPLTECPPDFDAKWRYFWRIGTIPTEEDNVILPPQTAPADFPEWTEVMNRWGNLMLDAVLTVAKMLAIGLDLDEDAFTERMRGGAHLLAPTGSDLTRYDVGTIFAGFHYDFNFLTIHGKAKYPGLSIWLKDGTKIPVKVADGCLLLQAGKQLEIMTGGYIKAGFHEVIYNEKVKELAEKAKAEGRIPWRISSTLFGHLNKDVMLEPIGQFATEEAKEKYPSMVTIDQVLMELRAIGLKKDSEDIKEAEPVK